MGLFGLNESEHFLIGVEKDNEYKESRSKKKSKPVHLIYWLRTYNHNRM